GRLPVRIRIGGELHRLNRVELLRSLDEIAFAHDVVALEHRSRLWPVICIATRSGMPARTRFRTAVRRRSCGIRPGQPACAHALPPRLRESHDRLAFDLLARPVKYPGAKHSFGSDAVVLDLLSLQKML